MAKLFSLESSDETSGLLIDKVIQKSKLDLKGLSVTAELIKQRQALKTQIDNELSTPAPDNADQGSTKKDPEPEPEPTGDGDSPADGDVTPTSDTKDGDGDAADQAQDLDKLQSLVGSGLGKGEKTTPETKPTEEPPAKKEDAAKDGQGKDTANESYGNFVDLMAVKLFQGLHTAHQRHRLAMEEYNLPQVSKDPKNQPVAYVKDEVISSLKKMLALSARYLSKNTSQVDASTKALLSLSENLTVYRQCQEAKRLHLTLAVVSEPELMHAVSTPESSDLKETSKALLRYLETSATLTAKILGNDLNTLEASLGSCGYKIEEGVAGYAKTLPGFNDLKVAWVHYEDYIKTKYEDYQAYRVKAIKVQDIHGLSGITINKDDDLTAILDTADKLITQAGLIADNLKSLGGQYSELSEEVKATCFDVEQDKVKQLAELGIDEHLKDFIRFKLSSELCCTGMDMVIEYLTGIVTTFSGLIELNEA